MRVVLCAHPPAAGSSRVSVPLESVPLESVPLESVSLESALESALVTHRGGCHCRAVRFACEAPAAIEVVDCNCSICRMTGYRHLVVPKARFTLLSGADELRRYRFGTRVAEHLFCAVCGIKSFYVPRSAPDCVSVNVLCLDPGTVTSETAVLLDGAHWELDDRGPPPPRRPQTER